MGTWRVVRTIVRGQWANDDCFLKWIGINVATIAIAEVVPVPAIQELAVPYHDTFATLYPFLQPEDFGSAKPTANDQQLYVVYQSADTPMPNCPNGNPSLVTSGGLNGWATQKEAHAVAEGELNKRNQIAAQVKKANEAAVNPGKIAGEAAAELAGDAKKGIAGVLASPWTWVAGAAAAALLVWKAVK